MVTIGVRLFYGELTDDEIAAGISAELAAKANKQIYGVQNIPELQSAPSAIDTTTLEDVEQQSEPGLISNSSLGITMTYKEKVYKQKDGPIITDKSGQTVNPVNEDASNFEQCLDISGDNIYIFKIVLPNGRYFAFFAKARTTVGGMGVAAVVPFTLTLFKRSKVFVGYDMTLIVPVTYSNDVITQKAAEAKAQLLSMKNDSDIAISGKDTPDIAVVNEADEELE